MHQGDPRSTQYGAHLTPQQLRALVTPPPGALADVRRWLRGNAGGACALAGADDGEEGRHYWGAAVACPRLGTQNARVCTVRCANGRGSPWVLWAEVGCDMRER